MEIPEKLLHSITAGRCVLYLGQETSSTTRSPTGKHFPSGLQLAEAIAVRFLEDSYKNRPLAELFDLATSESDPRTVQDFVAELLTPFLPSSAHSIIPGFYWQAIVSTALDLAVERAYDRAGKRQQNCVPLTHNGQSVTERLSSANDVMYLKLHGSITDTQSSSTALILHPDQYTTHKASRTRLFERLQEFALEFSLLAIGSSLSDPDLRAFLQHISEVSDARPTSYVVAPRYSSVDERLWASRRFVGIKCGFEEFMSELDSRVPASRRGLAPLVTNDHPILRRAAVPGRVVLQDELQHALQHDLEYLHQDYRVAHCKASEFYKGYLEDWAPIAQELDVKRHLTEQILTEVFLADEAQVLEKQRLYLLRGYAGSGKTVLLRRLAWDAAVVFERLCLFTRGRSFPSVEILRQVHSLTGMRIFLFVDRVEGLIDDLEKTLAAARRKDIPLTILGGIRSNVWSIYRERLDQIVSLDYELEYLNNAELEQLVILLDKHKSLGHLGQMTKRQQIEALAKRAGRQLLVALHEATLGRAFGDIVYDEYRSIDSDQARALYLTVCVLHSLDIPVRAGLVSRVHKIPFSKFSSDLFAPLNSIVYAKPSKSYRDHEYVTRHQQIAEMVVERALVDGRSRFDEYARISDCLDIDYETDRESLHGLMNARHLRRVFSDEDLARTLYSKIEDRFPDYAAVFHQRAIFEMNASPPQFEASSALLRRALNIEPRSRVIAHSMAELAIRRANHSKGRVDKERYRTEARRLLNAADDSESNAAFTLHSRLKLMLEELRDMEGSNNDFAFEEKVKEIEKVTTNALTRFPGSSHLLDAQSRFYSYLNEIPRALVALKDAYQRNRSSPYLALSLASLYDKRGNREDATKTLRDAVEVSPNSKELNLALARRLMELKAPDDEVRYYLHRSFIAGDARHEAQYLCAAFIYEKGDVKDAHAIFDRLRDADVPEALKRQWHNVIGGDDAPRRFSGAVDSLDASHAFIVRDQTQDTVFGGARGSSGVAWRDLKPGQRVTFNIGFNFFGPIALDILPEAVSTNSSKPKATRSRSQGKAVGSLRGEVDFAIITIKTEEFKATLDQFRCETPEVVHGARSYAVTSVTTENGDGPDAVVAITRCPSQGNGVSQDVARDIIEDLDPQWLLVVGIAGGAPAAEFSLGDVVLASSIHDFTVESVRVGGAREFAVEGRQVHPDVENYVTMVEAHRVALGSWYTLTVRDESSGKRVLLGPPPIDLSSENFSGTPDWQEKLRESLEHHVKREPARSRVVGVPIASSDRLMKDDELFTFWLAVARQVRAVEMESAGVHIAARGRGEARRSYPAMSIRGISDIVGFKRREEWTRYACETAAAFAYAFVRSGHVSPRSK